MFACFFVCGRSFARKCQVGLWLRYLILRQDVVISHSRKICQSKSGSTFVRGMFVCA